MLKTPITTEIIDYCQEHGCRESSVLKELRTDTLNLPNAQMLITPLQGAFLKLLVEIVNPQQIVEIGMFTGYSALWMASGLNHEASLITLDISNQHLELAKSYWRKAGVDNQITALIAPADLSLQRMLDSGLVADMVFIDANKAQYLEYYELAIKLLRPGGIVVIDNVLMYGQVLEANPDKNYIKTLQQLNQLIRDDQRVTISMLPVGDGITIARKKEC